MSLFVIIGRDEEKSAEKRETHLDAHLQALQKLNREKRLFSAGPIYKSDSSTDDADICGSILIVDFETLTDAKAWFEAEAYYTAGIYKEYEIKPYLDAMPYC